MVAAPAVRMSGKLVKAAPVTDWHNLAAEFAGNLDGAGKADLAEHLGLPVSALAALPLIGWNPSRNCWTFPELDGYGRVVGIAQRFADGGKNMAKGSNRGITVPGG